MNPSKFNKSEMGSNSKSFKHSFLPPGALARGRGQSFKSMGSLRVSAEKRTLIDPTDIMPESLRSKSEAVREKDLTSVGAGRGSTVVQRTTIEKSKGFSVASSDTNGLAYNKNLMQTDFNPIEVDTSFPRDDVEVMQEILGSKSESVRGKELTSVGAGRGSNVVQRTTIGKSKGFSAASSDTNGLAYNKNLMQHDFNPIEVDTSFSRDDVEVMEETLRSKSEAVRAKDFISLDFISRSVKKRSLIQKSKDLNSSMYDQNIVTQKTNPVPPGLDPMKDDVTFPLNEFDVMQETLRKKSANGNMKNFTSVGAGRRSTVLRRTSIEESKGFSIVSSDTNVLKRNKNLVQPDFDKIEDHTSFPHDDHEDMQDTLSRKSGRVQCFKSVDSVRKIAEKRTLDGQIKDRKNVTYDLRELAQNKNFVPLENDLMEDDLTLPRDDVDVMQDTQRRKTSPCESDKVKKVRGPNLCKVVTGVKPGEKLRVTFYQNRVVGDHHALFSRHLGSLVRDCNMCPLRVHSWADIEEAKLDHMWGAVTEKFDSDDMNDHRDHVLKHMRRLWNNWRGSLHMNAKSKPLQEKTSTRKSINKSKLSMPHRTGSKPIRKIIYELGGKHGNPPDIANIFFETRKKDKKLCEPETYEKYIEIQEVIQSEPSLTNIEVVERCFGPQRKSHVVGFGGGITSKDLKGGSSTKANLLEDLNTSRKEKAALLEELSASRKENESMRRRMDNIEKTCDWFESAMLGHHSPSRSSSEQNTC